MHFSRAGSKIQTRIEEGIERLCRATIRIDGERGYDYSPGYVPVLFRYAENINGEIIKIPTNLFNYGKLLGYLLNTLLGTSYTPITNFCTVRL